MTPEPVYPASTLALLAASRQREDAAARAASATRCGWCGETMTGTTCCGAEPWKHAA